MSIFPNWTASSTDNYTAEWHIPPDRFYESYSSATTLRSDVDAIINVYYGYDNIKKKKIAKIHNKLKLNDDMYKL